MAHEVEKFRPTDPRRQAYEAGMELARRMGVGGGGLGHQDGSPFDHPFFQEGQTKKERRVRREVHVIGEDEYKLIEETTETEVFSFGNDIFKKEGRS